MEQTDDIDLLLTLNPHGWSTFSLFIRDKKIEFSVSHVFGDPYFDLVQSLSNLISGAESVSFVWYGEPGGLKIEIQKDMTQQNFVAMSIYDFAECFGEEPKTLDLVLELKIKLKQLIALFYFQLKKTQILLQDKQFLKSRDKEFPFQGFQQFEKLVKP